MTLARGVTAYLMPPGSFFFGGKRQYGGRGELGEIE
jgi:hypothetical protein